MANLLDELGASNSPVVVPAHFGIVYADELRARGITLTPDGKLFDGLRRAKTEEEISHIEKTQRAVEAACAHAVGILQAGSGRIKSSTGAARPSRASCCAPR